MCSSTSDIVRADADAGAEHGTTVVADHQSAGRGRQRRPWLDRPGSALLLSMLLRGSERGAGNAALPLLVGLTCARAIRSCTGLTVGIEWPNDLVVGDAKLGGILCEAIHTAHGIDVVIAGVGINVDALPADLDDAARARATSLADALGSAPPARAALAEHICRELIRLRADAPLGGADHAELRALDSLAGRVVRFGTGREGIARGILPDGALAVEADGGVLAIRSGSVRPIGATEIPER